MMRQAIASTTFMPGEVALIGAGPGDPDLLTIKAVKYLQLAEVVLVDDLVDPRVLDHVSQRARVIHVGKRGGCVSTPQAFIEKQLIAEARQGHRVVRLKGGDPLMFGRGGEEIETLKQAGLKVTVINGVSSAFAAASALGISLTHRDHSAGVIFLTGHLKNAEHKPNWQALVKTGMTLVIYMGLSQSAVIQHELVEAGLSTDTPVGLVQSASTPQEQMVVTCLRSLTHTVSQHRLRSPVIMIIGDVIAGVTQLVAQSKAA